MQFREQDLRMNEREMEKEIRRFIDLTDEKVWSAKIGQVKSFRESRKDSNIIDIICYKNPFIEPIEQFIGLRDQGKSIWKHKTDELVWLASTVSVINRIVHNSSDSAKKKILSSLVDDLNRQV